MTFGGCGSGQGSQLGQGGGPGGRHQGSPGGYILGVLGLLWAFALCYYGASNAAVATGLAGTHGTLTVGRCQAHSGGAHYGPSRQCEGVFRPDGDRRPDGDQRIDEESGGREARAHIASWTAQPGEVIEVRKGTGEYLRPGHNSPRRYLFFAFGGLLVAAAMLPVTVRGTGPRALREGRSPLTEVRGTWTGKISKWLAIIGAIGLAADILFALAVP
ncbi:membrane protein [Streptomyces noursei ATCC 11455]|uniref:hypothetical protein n=1 Tax=Streptomyces noursei TaxID=1971 RepID=UPI00081D191E|nr:membrane protein [Streptomyces noursei ATCC 11455]